MATARAYWKGYLKLSLVSCPIALYTGTSSTERVSFRQINKKTGNRLRQQLVDEITREPVEPEDKGRGYEYAKNAYIPVDDDELDAIAIESNHTIEIDSFVPREQIDERYLDSPYYIAPNDQVGQEAFAVIREAMRGKGMASARSCRAGKARACHHDRALGQGTDGDHATLSLRDQGRERIFRRHPKRAARARHAQAGRAYPPEQGDRLRPVPVRRSLRRSRRRRCSRRNRPACRSRASRSRRHRRMS